MLRFNFQEQELTGQSVCIGYTMEPNDWRTERRYDKTTCTVGAMTVNGTVLYKAAKNRQK